MRNRLKWCVVSVLPILILSLAPQARLWFARGMDWNGAYAIVDGDEFLYSAYVNSLIDGRPRRNDPFSGRDDNPISPLPESTFSIQYLPPHVISWIARLFGFSASTAFIVLIAFSASSAAVATFWILALHIHEHRLITLGTLVVLLLGTSAAGQGILGAFFTQNVSTLGLAFLRRYQPAAAFFLFFIFCGLADCATRSNKRIKRLFLGILAGVTLGSLMFSYLYLWTAAAAWVITFTALRFYFDAQNRRQTLEVVAIIIAVAGFASVPYLHLLSGRAHTLNETQTLISTHQPDLFRLPEILGALMILAVTILVRRQRIQLLQPSTIFALSFGVLPLVIFNQQVVTGRSMQPFHFQHYIINYAVLIGAVILLANFTRLASVRRLAVVTMMVLLWGVAEVAVPTEIRNRWNVKNDQIVPVLLRLKAFSVTDGTLSDLRSQGRTSKLVFSPDIDVLMLVPTWTAQGTMIGVGGLDFGSANFEDRKVFAYLYYSGADTARLEELLEGKSNDLGLNYYARSALFGHERVLPQLSLHRSVIQEYEIQEQLRAYNVYVASFSLEEALKHPIGYVIVQQGSHFDFSRIDRWYVREFIERVGEHDLYRVTARTPKI